MASAAIPQREIIRFEAGRTETVCLKYATGKQVNGAGGPQFMFTTIDDRIFFIDPDIAYNIERCGAPVGEPILITKTKGPRNIVNWDVRPATSSTAGRVTIAPPVPMPDSELETTLKASIAHAQQTQATRATAAGQQPITSAQAKLLAALCVAIVRPPRRRRMRAAAACRCSSPARISAASPIPS